LETFRKLCLRKNVPKTFLNFLMFRTWNTRSKIWQLELTLWKQLIINWIFYFFLLIANFYLYNKLTTTKIDTSKKIQTKFPYLQVLQNVMPTKEKQRFFRRINFLKIKQKWSTYNKTNLNFEARPRCSTLIFGQINVEHK